MKIEIPKLAKLLLIVLLAINHTVMAADNSRRVKEKNILDSLNDEAWSLYKQGQSLKARELVDKGLAIDPDSPALAVLSGMLYADKKQCDAANRAVSKVGMEIDAIFHALKEEELDPVVELGGKEEYEKYKLLYIYANLILGTCHHDLMHWEESKRRLVVLEQEWPAGFDIPEASRLADDYMATKDYANARHYYTKANDMAQLKFRNAKEKTAKGMLRGEYERAQYNLVIVTFLLGERSDSTKWFYQLLRHSSRREYWIAKMKKDEDYVPILGSREFQEIVERASQSE